MKIKNLQGGLTSALSFAVVGNLEKFSQKLHAYKALKALQELGAEVYPVAADLEKVEKTKVYPSLLSLPKKVDVVVACLPQQFALNIVQEAAEAGIGKVWFQQKTASDEAVQFCLEHDISFVSGCVLMYREFGGLFKYLNPCLWHAKTFARKQK